MSVEGQSESERTPRHEVYLEQQVTTETTERAAWLESVLGSGFTGGMDVKNPVDTQEYLKALKQWEQDIPASRPLLERLAETIDTSEGTGKPIPQMATEALRDDDWQTLNAIQELGKALVTHYGSNQGRAGWDALPETARRYVRLGEMCVLMVDTFKTGGKSDEQKGRLASKLLKYASSTDIPQSFRSAFITPITNAFFGNPDKPTQQQQHPQSRSTNRRARPGQSSKRTGGAPRKPFSGGPEPQTPDTQAGDLDDRRSTSPGPKASTPRSGPFAPGPNLHSLWGAEGGPFEPDSPTIHSLWGDANANNDKEVLWAELVDDSDIPVAELDEPDDNVIDTEYDPRTGVYRAVGDLSDDTPPPSPPRLPGSTPPPSEPGPSTPPPAAPSPPPAGPAPSAP